MTDRRYKLEDVGCIRIYRSPSTDEFVVKPIGARTDDEAYYTNDIEDARDTAQTMNKARTDQETATMKSKPKTTLCVMEQVYSRYVTFPHLEKQHR